MRDKFFPTIETLRVRGKDQQSLHARASDLAAGQFGREVFVRAVVEVSNFCRENCHYCGMRRDNRSLARFRARHDELAELLINACPPSVTDINIQTGEDPLAVRELIIPLIKTLKEETTLGISICLGTLAPALYRELREAGASYYIIKFEMANARHYERLEAPGTLSERIENIRWLAANDWSVSSGFISGLPGETESDVLENFSLARSLPLKGCSVSPFIPGGETPLAGERTGDLELVLNSMAALRLMRPDWVIPAVSALNLAGPDSGYRRGLRTGANLCTINLTPAKFRGDYLLYKRERFIMTEERILSAISAEGLRPSKTGLAQHLRARSAEPTRVMAQSA